MNTPRTRAAATALWVLAADIAQAGMPTISLTDVGRARLSSISFFLLLLLICTVVVQRLWNALARDFARLPRLSFRGALAGVVLWGLLFIVVLTMISGARELMTPGAWIRTGFTSRLTLPTESSVEQQVAQEVSRQLQLRNVRQERLQQLGMELRRWREQHDGQYPTVEQFQTLPAELRQVPGDLPAEYVYLPPATDAGDAADSANSPLIVEPAIFGDTHQLSLYRSGAVVGSGSQP
ncbi:MAG: hypothetical protein ACKO2P_21015 [Planctomycetota bacterium]